MTNKTNITEVKDMLISLILCTAFAIVFILATLYAMVTECAGAAVVSTIGAILCICGIVVNFTGIINDLKHINNAKNNP